MVDTELNDDEDGDRARPRLDSPSESRLRPRSRSFFARISSASPLLFDVPWLLGVQNVIANLAEGQHTFASSHLELHLSISASGSDSKVAVSAMAATCTADLALRLCIHSCNGVEDSQHWCRSFGPAGKHISFETLLAERVRGRPSRRSKPRGISISVHDQGAERSRLCTRSWSGFSSQESSTPCERLPAIRGKKRNDAGL